MVNLQPSIFVSYAHEDADLAHAFVAALEREGARVWLDQGELLIGDSLIERISEAIAEFDFVAALVSIASVVSSWCRKEIALAMSKDLRRGARRVTVLPLRVGDVAMPASLSDQVVATRLGRAPALRGAGSQGRVATSCGCYGTHGAARRGCRAPEQPRLDRPGVRGERRRAGANRCCRHGADRSSAQRRDARQWAVPGTAAAEQSPACGVVG